MGKKRLIDANALFGSPPKEMNILILGGGRSIGKTAAMFEQIFRERVDAAPTVNAMPVTPVRVIETIDMGEIMSRSDEKMLKVQIAYQLGMKLLDGGYVEITRKVDPGRQMQLEAEYEFTAFVGDPRDLYET